MDDLKEGWYCVSYLGGWQCAEWDGLYWSLLGVGVIEEKALKKIGCRINMPDEASNEAPSIVVLDDLQEIDEVKEWCRNKPEDAAIQLLRYRKLYGKA